MGPTWPPTFPSTVTMRASSALSKVNDVRLPFALRRPGRRKPISSAIDRVNQYVTPAVASSRTLLPEQVEASPHAWVMASLKVAPPTPPDRMIPMGGAAHELG